MKKIFASIFAATLLLVGTEAYAQLVPGVGYLLSLETSNTSSDSETTPFHGFYAGVSYNIPIVAGLSVAPGLYANMLFRNGHEEYREGFAGLYLQGSYREFALNVPVNVAYSIELAGDMAIRFFAGPVFQYGLMSKTNYSGSLTIPGVSVSGGKTIKHYDSETIEIYRRNPFNIYLGGGIGFQAGDLLFTVGYDHSLLDVDKIDSYKTCRNQIKAGINFAF